MRDRDPSTTCPTTNPGITVVVPAYNPGPYLDRCLESLINQTLDRSLYEVIVIDDGSDDGSSERLDRAAREHPGLIRVEHRPRSGGPGGPRNLGTDLSNREYVFYCDADDWLLPDALGAILDAAVADRADVVMVRLVGRLRRVATAIYDEGDRCTTWKETPGVFSNLTCHKAFRRQFLLERDIRFPEGRVRLEDFIFMTAAYLRAERISILGSRPCYVFELRNDGQNITASRATEAEYFSSVEKIVDIVLADTVPGPDQDRALDRVVRSEIMGPLSRPPLLRKAHQTQTDALAHGRRLLESKIPASALARLDVVSRHRAELIQQGDLSAIVARIELDEAVTLTATVENLTLEGAQLCVRIGLALRLADEIVELGDEGDALVLPRATPSEAPVDVTAEFARSNCQLHVRNRRGTEEWRVRAAMQAVPQDGGPAQPLAWTATLLIDVHTLAGGSTIDTGVWDLLVAVSSCGYARRCSVRAVAGSDPAEPPVSASEGRRVRAYWGKSGALTLSVRPAEAPVERRDAKGRTFARRANWISRRTARRLVYRAAVRLVEQAGLSVTRIDRGMVAVSRSPEVDLAPLTSGRSWMLSKRCPSRPAVVPQQLGECHWLVSESADPAAALVVRPIGARGWLVSRQEKSRQATLNLENETLHHLGARHIAWLLRHYDVDLVLDVGANTGQYGQELRANGYHGRIESFEPVPSFVNAVEALTVHDERWHVHGMALGATEGTVPIRVQRTFTSVLPASNYGKGRFSTLRDHADKDEYVVNVPLRRLDSVLTELLPQVVRADGTPPRVFLKMDTQGFDLEVFRGLGHHVTSVVGLQSEVALLLIYEGMPRMPEAVATYEGAGFELSGLYPVTTEPDGRVIEYDCVMVRASAAPLHG